MSFGSTGDATALDTHSFPWFASGNDKLNQQAKEAIADTGNAAYLSTASFWEMAIFEAKDQFGMSGGKRWP